MPTTNEITQEIESEFIRQVDTWFSLGMNVWDSDLDRQIHKWFAEVEDVKPKYPYFSPSSLNSCPRELYLKAKNAKKDNFPRPPYQGRWQRLGGLGGDMLQREILMMEKHYETVTGGEKSKFRFARTEDGLPMFEEFVKMNMPIQIDGEFFYLFGLPDGVMEYTRDNGEVIRVGLEIKSKQTTSARTSAFSMREAEEDHVVQSIAYSTMYDCDYYLIVYVNYSKKSWVLTDEEYEKTPDLRAFCLEISDQDRFETLLFGAEVRKAVNEDKPPKLDITKWGFNNYKTACANHLTNEEVEEVAQFVDEYQSAQVPAFLKRQVVESFEQLKELRQWG